MTASKYLQKLLSLHGIHIDKTIKGGEGPKDDLDFQQQVLKRANDYYKLLRTVREETPRFISSITPKSEENLLVKDDSNAATAAAAAAAAAAFAERSQENPVEEDDTDIDSIAAAAAAVATSTTTEQNKVNTTVKDDTNIASIAAAAAVATSTTTEQNKVNTTVKDDTNIASIAAAAAVATSTTTEQNKVTPVVEDDTENPVVKHDTDIDSIAAAAAAAASSTTTEQNKVTPVTEQNKENPVVKHDTDIVSIAAAAAAASSTTTEQNKEIPVTEQNKENPVVKHDTDIASIAAAAVVAANTIINQKGIVDENIENTLGDQVTQSNWAKVIQYIRDCLSTFNGIKLSSLNFPRINFDIVNTIKNLNIDLGLKEQLTNLWNKINLGSFFQNFFQRKANTDSVEKSSLTTIMEMFMAMRNIPISEFMKIFTTPIFDSLDLFDKFAILLTKTIKDGFKSVSKTKPTPTANIKQIENGIDPRYGGGFIMFDDKFKIVGVIHSGYNVTTSEIKMSNSTTNSNDINKFVSDLKSTNNYSLLDISKIVESIKDTVIIPTI